MNENLEYLDTDGRGGFFCGTFSGEITRKWHGWWVAENPPRARRRVFAGFDLRVTYDGKDYWLTKHWEKDRWVEADVENVSSGWIIKDWFILLSIKVDENGVLIFYFLTGIDEVYKKPIVHLRLLYPIDQKADTLAYTDEGRKFNLASDRQIETLTDVTLQTEKDCEKIWTENLRREAVHSFEIYDGIPVEIAIHSGDAIASYKAKWLLKDRKEIIISSCWQKDKLLPKDLYVAADHFIARGKDGSTTILAGYPWFTDWGRDAMISIPGLCIATGRIAEAREIVQHFLAHMNQGLIPNIFPEKGDQPRYNTVDATLWLVDVVFRLWTEDEIARDEQLCSKLREIIEWHERGTLNNIRVAEDGLLIAGEAGAQITWMDVKVNGEVPTPRHGKPVEIQGLWFNALTLIGSLANRRKDTLLANRCTDLAKRCSESFAKRFVAEDKTHLADVVDRDGADTADWSLRPNMVIPFSLHYNILPAEKRADVLGATAAELLTPRGLRTLGPQEPKYHGIYRGDVVARDHAYHQGTVWMWLLGPYFAGVIAEKARVPELYAQLRSIAEGLIDHFNNEGCVHQCNEIFDGDAPHTPRGCFAQAWSTAALIQILQYDLD